MFVGAGVLVGICVGSLFWNSQIDSKVAIGTEGTLTSRVTGNTVSADLPDTSGNERAGEIEWLASALEYLSQIGFSAETIEQVAATLPPARAQALRVIAIEGLAERNIRSAIAYALTFDRYTAQIAGLRRVAGIAVASDPYFALDSATLIVNGSLRAVFTERVLRAWAVVDPAAVLTYLEINGLSGSPVTAATLSELASVEPERLLAFLDPLPLDLSTDAERALIDALLASDPGSVYAHLETERFGLDSGRGVDFRMELQLAEVWRRHIRLDAKEALKHLLSMRAPLVLAVHEALLAVPDEDFEAEFQTALDRSIEMLATGEEPQVNGGRLARLFEAAFQREVPEIGAMLDAIANHPSSRVRNQVGIGIDAGASSIVAVWAEYDPDSAVAWTIRNVSGVSPPTLEHLGQLFAEEFADPASAQRVLYELPDEVRGYWMAGVAEGLASSNLDAALAWLEPARGAPIYATVMDSVLRSAASTDPVALAGIIDNLPDPPGTAVVVTVATEWGSREPASAGDWLAASQNIDDEMRAIAIRQLVARWAERDLREAEAWTRGLTRGELRDVALGAVVEAAAADGSLESQLLATFSSDSSRARAIIGAMYTLRRSDADLGRRLIDQYISDPDLRDEAEQVLDGRAPDRFPSIFDGVWIR